MNIALNARHMIKDRLEGIGTVTNEIMSHMVRLHPEDKFDYYFDRKYDPIFIHGPNVSGHSFFPPARLPVLIRYWMDHPVKNHLQSHQQDVFFSPDGFVPLQVNIPKVTMVHDIAFLRNPLHVTPRIRKFYSDWMPRYIDETDHIITVSEFSKTELVSAYDISPEKISVVYNGVSKEFHSLSNDVIKEVKEKYFNGHPFFLYLGAIHPRKNILTLISAFEKFKSEKKSDYHLVIAGRPSWYTKEVFNSVKESKWKGEIHLPGFVDTETARKFLASAHAMIYPSRYEGFGLPMVEAMASGTPVISSNMASLPEIAGNAALFFDPDDIEDLVNHLQRITADTQLRNNLISAGHQRIKHFSWNEAAKSTYEILQKFSKA